MKKYFRLLAGGYLPVSLFLMPLLGFGHPEDFPRFRDCYFEDGKIYVFTTMGGKNYACEQGGQFKQTCNCFCCQIYRIEMNELYIGRRSENQHGTGYWLFAFDIPKKWKKDVEKILRCDFKETSIEYKRLMLNTVKEFDGFYLMLKLFGRRGKK